MTEATTLSLISHWFSVCKCMKLKMSANVNYRADLGLKLVRVSVQNYIIIPSHFGSYSKDSIQSVKQQKCFYFAVKQKEKQEMLAVCETYVTAAQRNQLDPTSYFTSLIY